MVDTIAAPTHAPNFTSGALNAGWFFLDGYDGIRYVEAISGWSLVRSVQRVLYDYFVNVLRLDTDFSAFREGGPWERSSLLNSLDPENYNFEPKDIAPNGVPDGKWNAGVTAALWRYVANQVRTQLGPSPRAEQFDPGTLAALDAIEQTFLDRRVNPTTMIVAIWVSQQTALGLPWTQLRRVSFGTGTVTTVPWDRSPDEPTNASNRQLSIVGRLPGSTGGTPPVVVPTPGPAPVPGPNGPGTPTPGAAGPKTSGGAVIAVAGTALAIGTAGLVLRKILQRRR